MVSLTSPMVEQIILTFILTRSHSPKIALNPLNPKIGLTLWKISAECLYASVVTFSHLLLRPAVVSIGEIFVMDMLGVSYETSSSN